MLGLQTLDELDFNERNDRFDTALLPDEAPCTLRADHEDAYHTLPWLKTTEKYTRVMADYHPKNTVYYRGG